MHKDPEPADSQSNDEGLPSSGEDQVSVLRAKVAEAETALAEQKKLREESESRLAGLRLETAVRQSLAGCSKPDLAMKVIDRIEASEEDGAPRVHYKGEEYSPEDFCEVLREDLPELFPTPGAPAPGTSSSKAKDPYQAFRDDLASIR